MYTASDLLVHVNEHEHTEPQSLGDAYDNEFI